MQDNEAAFDIAGAGEPGGDLDDDGHPKRTGTLVTASAHIITAVIGSGVLSLAWAIAQLGWLIGLAVLVAFSLITGYCSTLLADCYRSPDPVHGKRNYTYGAAVRAILGASKFKFCALAQYATMVGVCIGYTITTAISMGAIKKSNCFHRHGHDAPCKVSNTNNMIIFAGVQIVLSQLPNFHKIWWLSIVASVMSVAYSCIGLGLSIARIAEGRHVRTTLTGVTVGVDVTEGEKVWRAFQALGNIAFAYSYSNVLIEIQDTLKCSPPENKVMKKASFVGVSTTTLFYMLCGVLGYAAFGNQAPGNFLTGFGFYEPYWLIDAGNLFIVVHLIGAYQVFCQPFHQFVEGWMKRRWPNSGFVMAEHVISVQVLGAFPVSPFRLTWRTSYVVLTTLIAMVFPFFNDFLGLIGALSFWPLTIYFPVEMYKARAKTHNPSGSCIWLDILSMVCLLVSVPAACGSVQGLIHSLKNYRPFQD